MMPNRSEAVVELIGRLCRSYGASKGSNGQMRGKITGWKKVHNEELHNLPCSQNDIRQIISRRMGCNKHGRNKK
jgi:hypothetical protein